MIRAYASLEKCLEYSDMQISDEKPPKFLGKIKVKTHTIKDTGLTYRTLNHWAAEGLLDDGRNTQGKGWRKFSLYDRLWIQVIIELRKYGLPFKRIRTIKQRLFSNNAFEGPPHTWFDYAIIRCAANKKSQTYLVVFDDGSSEIVSYNDLSISQDIMGIHSYLLLNLNKVFASVYKGKVSLFGIL